jgi:site-specific DNA-methyltransferase (adenine-specific)
MKFDVVIGNPPYQLNRDGNDADYPLWLNFVNFGVKHLAAAGKLVFITPPKFIGQKRPASTRSKVDYSVFLDNKVDYIKVLTQEECAEYFSGVGSKFAIYVISKDTPKMTPVSIGDRTFNVDLENAVPAPHKINDLTAKLFQQLMRMDKFTFYDDYSCHSQTYKKGNWSDTPTDLCPVPIVVSHKIIRYTDFKQDLFDKPKILIPAVSTINNACFSQYSNFGEDMKYLEVKSEEEANNILSILKSKLYKFIGDNFRPGRNLDKIARNIFPKLDTNKSWTDEDIYKAFDLSEQELNEIQLYA